MINLGVIGCGHWGPNYIRIFSNAPGSHVSICCDSDTTRLAAMKELFPAIKTTSDYRDLLRDEIDAVVITTPTSTHYEIAKASLEQDKHVLVEKPMTTTIEKAKDLVKTVKDKKKILMVGHVFMYNSGIRKLKEYIRTGILGKIYCVRSIRTNLGPIREDVNSVWDLATHDVSIFSYLLDFQPLQVSCKGASFLQPGIEDIAFISLMYPENILANIHVSWLDPRKIREITIVGEKKMVVWDDLSSTSPIRIYDNTVLKKKEQYYKDFGEFQLLIKEGDITIPKISLSEPLKNEAIHFLECIKKEKNPLSNGTNGLEVVRAVSAIQKSMEMNGTSIDV